jgi:hypothetical protein
MKIVVRDNTYLVNEKGIKVGSFLPSGVYEAYISKLQPKIGIDVAYVEMPDFKGYIKCAHPYVIAEGGYGLTVPFISAYEHVDDKTKTGLQPCLQMISLYHKVNIEQIADESNPNKIIDTLEKADLEVDLKLDLSFKDLYNELHKDPVMIMLRYGLRFKFLIAVGYSFPHLIFHDPFKTKNLDEPPAFTKQVLFNGQYRFLLNSYIDEFTYANKGHINCYTIHKTSVHNDIKITA